jgi:hypothetical protein
LSRDPEGDIATDMRSSRSETAIENWVTALNTRGSQMLVCVEAAVHPDVRVVRYGFGANQGRVVEEIHGVTGVAEWFGLTPDVIEFELAGPVDSLNEENGVEDAVVRGVRYQVLAGDFVNGGSWRFRVHEDGRIIWLEHRPDEVDDAVQEGSYRLGRAVPEMKSGRDPGETGTSTHHHHGHPELSGLSIGHPHHHGDHHHDH